MKNLKSIDHVGYAVHDIMETAKYYLNAGWELSEVYEEDFKPLFFPVESVAMKNRKICYLYNTKVGLIELVNQE